MNEPIKPITLEYVVAKNKIISAVNSAIEEHRLPYFLVEEIVSGMLHSLKAEAKIERENALLKYQQDTINYKKEQDDSVKNN